MHGARELAAEMASHAAVSGEAALVNVVKPAHVRVHTLYEWMNGLADRAEGLGADKGTGALGLGAPAGAAFLRNLAGTRKLRPNEMLVKLAETSAPIHAALDGVQAARLRTGDGLPVKHAVAELTAARIEAVRNNKGS